ncbi:MarR family transcriptional regulator [Streptomyces sp. NPDC101151]|uniref:MarR family transcriptional regulator n=1 Tax=Streptomyces sp. NPDC101151 TaxID=3366115 RepID=UPI00381E12DE
MSPGNGLHDHLGYWLRRLSDEVDLSFERALAGHGVTVAQWNVLITVYHGRAGNIRAAARHIGIDTGAVSRLVDRLADKGLVRRAPDPDSKRSVILKLTPAGEELVPHLIVIADLNEARYFGKLDATRRTQLEASIRELLGETAPSPPAPPQRGAPAGHHMPATVRAVTKAVTLARPPQEVFSFLADPANWPLWAVADVKAIEPEGESGWWRVSTPRGPARLRIRSHRELGLLDHDYIEQDARWSVPARVVPNGEGSEFMMTFMKPPSFTDDVFDARSALIDTALAALKDVLESRTTGTPGPG